MKFFLLAVVVALAILLMSAAGVAAVSVSQSRQIVVFSDEVVNRPAREAIIRATGGILIKHLDLINASAVLLPPQAEMALRLNSQIKRIDPDVEVQALPHRDPSPTPAPVQTLPWGVDRIEADQAWATSSGTAVKVAILDTGIDLDHPDLAVNVKGVYNAIRPRRSADDDNGHGSHVAGTVAAVHNSTGVVGVSHTAHLYAVKVLDRYGRGFISDVIEGLDWAVANNMQVVNMSLGTGSDILSFHDAVDRVNQAGIVQVAAAGNDGGAVDFPAAYPPVIAVAAVEQNADGTLAAASFTSRGAEVDLSAPGHSIYSTYKNGGYSTASGTSMASPHVTGSAALVLTTQVGSSDTNANGRWDPAEVLAKLQVTAENIGLDLTQFGAGLVRPDLALP